MRLLSPPKTLSSRSLVRLLLLSVVCSLTAAPAIVAGAAIKQYEVTKIAEENHNIGIVNPRPATILNPTDSPVLLRASARFTVFICSRGKLIRLGSSSYAMLLLLLMK